MAPLRDVSRSLNASQAGLLKLHVKYKVAILPSAGIGAAAEEKCATAMVQLLFRNDVSGAA